MLLTLVLSIGFAAMPESALGTACLGLVVFWWALAASDGVPVGAVPAALLLLAAHVAAVVLSYGPSALPIGAALLGRWLRRGVGVGVAAPLVWLVAVVVDGQPEPPGIWVSGLACAVVVCIVAADRGHDARGWRRELPRTPRSTSSSCCRSSRRSRGAGSRRTARSRASSVAGRARSAR